jgi:hypothetical protein
MKNDNIEDNKYSENIIDREIDGCKVRLFFSLSHNNKVERTVLDNLMLVFEKRKQEIANVQT